MSNESEPVQRFVEGGVGARPIEVELGGDECKGVSGRGHIVDVGDRLHVVDHAVLSGTGELTINWASDRAHEALCENLAMADSPDHVNGDRIVISNDLEAVRQRPEMYLGPSPRLTDLVFEAMCLALAEAHCGSVTTISVSVNGPSFSVADDGLGISLEPDRRSVPFAQSAMTVLYACRDHKEHERLKRKLCGAGLALVNAVATTAAVVSSDGSASFQQSYTSGVPDGDFEATSDVRERGTVLKFDIDTGFLADVDFDEAHLRSRIHEIGEDFGAVLIRVEAEEVEP